MTDPFNDIAPNDQRFGHLRHLHEIVDADLEQLNEKERQYGASWKSRGGVGAFMMLARKWDRLENMIGQMRSYQIEPGEGNRPPSTVTVGPYDLFDHIRAQTRQGGGESLMDTLGDLRRYLLLVEAEVMRLQRTNLMTQDPTPIPPRKTVGLGELG
jgi:hypothetical protein